MRKSHQRTPNDQRSDAFNSTSAEYRAAQIHNTNIHNPTSSEYKDAMDNKANQMNPNNTASKGKKQ
jgi:hypothetical protein